MASYKPLILLNGKPAQLQAGDTLDASVNEVDVSVFSNANAGTITKGQPVYVSGSGAVNLARANASGTAAPIGLVADTSIASSASGAIQTNGVLTLSDWTSVIGSTNLTAGADYFLSAGTSGQLTTTAPSTTGQYVTIVGKAISATALMIDIETEILL